MAIATCLGRGTGILTSQSDVAKLQQTQCNLPHESDTGKILAILITVYVTAVIAIVLRLIAKNLAKTWSLDDALIIAAIVIAIAPVSAIILSELNRKYMLGYATYCQQCQA